MRTLIVLVLLAGSAAGQSPVRFRWQSGQSQLFKVAHTTTVTELAPLTAGGKPVTTTSTTKLTLTRRWDVRTADATGATLTMTVLALRNEIQKPLAGADGAITTETLVVDSDTPEGAAQVAEYLNKPILTVKVDSRGAVTEVSSTTGDGAVSRLKAELPFRVLLPETTPATGGTWDRPFTLSLDPPVGTGEKHDFKQTYTYRGTNAEGYAVIGLVTELVKPPTAAADLQPLLPWLWVGDVFVHVETGRYAGAKFTSKREIDAHQGVGTKFTFTSEFSEAVVPGK